MTCRTTREILCCPPKHFLPLACSHMCLVTVVFTHLGPLLNCRGTFHTGVIADPKSAFHQKPWKPLQLERDMPLLRKGVWTLLLDLKSQKSPQFLAVINKYSWCSIKKYTKQMYSSKDTFLQKVCLRTQTGLATSWCLISLLGSWLHRLIWFANQPKRKDKVQE